MNSIEISKILGNDHVLNKIFGGVYSLGNLPTPRKFPTAIIVNVGRHWVALYFQNPRRIEYFDPLGKPPPAGVENVTKYNKIAVQPPKTRVCGHFCIYFLVFRSRGFSISKIINTLRKPLADLLVSDFVMHLVQKQSELIFSNSMKKLE